ncbi:MAG TPA: response regulator [Aeromonadales bacterium]|nr:response regulator [Aeromonadales bacterium]
MSEAVKILAFEDSRLDAELLKVLLTTGPYQVRVVSDGQLALEAVNTEKPPHIVICDINLPGVDGIHIIQSIRKNEHWKNLPVIAMSACMDYKTVNKAMLAGATSVLAKPYDPQRLQKEVLKLTGYERVEE